MSYISVILERACNKYTNLFLSYFMQLLMPPILSSSCKLQCH